MIKAQRNRYPNQPADARKILEAASMGTLSKLYKSLKAQLPEKAIIPKGMGFNLNTELSSWLAEKAIKLKLKINPAAKFDLVDIDSPFDLTDLLQDY